MSFIVTLQDSEEKKETHYKHISPPQKIKLK